MLVKAPNSGGVSCQSTNTLRESPGMYCQSTNTAEGVTPIVVARWLQICLLKHRILGESLAKVPTLWGVSGYVLSKYQHWLRESRNSGCQVFSNVLVKVPVVDWLRELHLFSVKPVSSFLCLLHTSISFKTVQVLRACKQGTNRFEMRS